MTTHSPDTEPRWRRLPEERPRQILDAAFEVFGERGLAGAKLDDIAKRAGVAKGTIYLYFPNKEELFRAVVRERALGHIERAEEALTAERGSMRDVLERGMRDWWDYLRSPTFEVIHRLVHGELLQFPDLAEFYSREVIQRGMSVLAALVRRGTERGEFRPVDPHAAARVLSSMMITHAIWCSRRGFFHHVDDVTDDEAFRQVMDFYFHALLPHGSGARTTPRA
jgi:AcrR family transcriptional regulator